MTHRYVALLRGINIGPHKKVPMSELKELFQGLGFTGVTTLLNTGNVIFDSTKTSVRRLPDIESTILERFGFPVSVQVHPRALFDAIVEADPFRRVRVMPDTRLYVSFVGSSQKSGPSLPHSSLDGALRVIAKEGAAVFSVLDLSKAGTPDAMAVLERAFGKDITTRNWNTVQKIVRGL